jgi:hypothetical protein
MWAFGVYVEELLRDAAPAAPATPRESYKLPAGTVTDVGRRRDSAVSCVTARARGPKLAEPAATVTYHGSEA